MRLPEVVLIVFVALTLAIDAYMYFIIRRRCGAKWGLVQLSAAIALYILMIVAVSLPRNSGGNDTLITVMWLLFGFLSVYFGKAIFVLFDLIAQVPRLCRGRRLRVVTMVGVVAGVISFFIIWWGALINRFRIDVHNVSVEVVGLPDSFDGLRIIQFSDLHVGTYGNDTAFVSSLVNTINSQNADIVFFTGDIVNRRTDELYPFTEVLRELKAPLGVYSILGNHDYGDYSTWSNEGLKRKNNDELKELQAQMGWDLLLNEHRTLYREGDSIVVIGVENVGDPPFKCYGSLMSSYDDFSDDATKILLTHNPVHWVDSVAENENVNIALTLSGHTHAMQIEMLGWSPAKYRYKTWGGLYKSQDKNNQLYVNIGIGTVGLPMRLGATPEITVITLKKISK